MHGTIRMEERKKLIGAVPLMPMSFPKGRVWAVCCAVPQRMHWVTRDRLVGCPNGFYEQRKIGAFAAEHDVLDLGFETFAPAELRTKIVNGRKREWLVPVFGNYFFARFDREIDWWEYILDLESIIDLFRIGEMPVWVPDDVMELLQGAEKAGVFQKQPFEEGDSVQIMQGPFAGIFAKIKAARPRQRAILLMQFLGTMEIDPCFLEKA